jgi:hypothetical protein
MSNTRVLRALLAMLGAAQERMLAARQELDRATEDYNAVAFVLADLQRRCPDEWALVMHGRNEDGTW